MPFCHRFLWNLFLSKAYFCLIFSGLISLTLEFTPVAVFEKALDTFSLAKFDSLSGSLGVIRSSAFSSLISFISFSSAFF
jgi:hypothetical protein